MILCIFVSLLSLKYTIYHTKWKFSFKTNLNKSKDQNCKRAHIITKIKLQKARHIIKLLCKKFLILCTSDIDKKNGQYQKIKNACLQPEQVRFYRILKMTLDIYAKNITQVRRILLNPAKL